MFAAIRDRLARGAADGDLSASPADIDAIVRYYTTVALLHSGQLPLLE